MGFFFFFSREREHFMRFFFTDLISYLFVVSVSHPSNCMLYTCYLYAF